MEQIMSGELLAKTESLKADGWRVAQICGITEESGEVELIYSFGKGWELQNFAVMTRPGETVPSLTPIIWSAFIYENEIHDLFDVRFEGSTLDFGGKFFKLSKPHPWTESIGVIDAGAQKAEGEN